MRKTFIQWCDYTQNFWWGCIKLGIECARCYLYRIVHGNGGSGRNIFRMGDKKFYEALYWKEPGRVFTCSMSDFFLQEADAWRDDAWDVIRRTPWLTWLILTKRPERIKQCLPDDWGNGWNNVWLGVSVGIQESFHRAKTLADIPAKIRFISAEPLLEELDFLLEHEGELLMSHFQWVIIGGESGNESGPYQYRPCKLEWIESAVNQLRTIPETAIFIKQMGSHLKDEMGLEHYHGGDPKEWPEHLRILEHPDTLGFTTAENRNLPSAKSVTLNFNYMRKIELEILDEELFIYDLNQINPEHPDFIDETPIHLSVEEATETVDVEGYGKNLSKLIFELSGYSWVDKFYLTEVARLLKMSFPNTKINWNTTSDYLSQIA